MVGGVLQGFGRIFLASGALLLLAGGVVAGFGLRAQQVADEADGEPDARDTARSKMLQTAGGAAAAAGLHVLVVGAILLASGRSQARHAQRQALASASRPEGLDDAAEETVPLVGEVGGVTARARKVAIMMVALIGLLAVVLALGMVGRS